MFHLFLFWLEALCLKSGATGGYVAFVCSLCRCWELQILLFNHCGCVIRNGWTWEFVILDLDRTNTRIPLRLISNIELSTKTKTNETYNKINFIMSTQLTYKLVIFSNLNKLENTSVFHSSFTGKEKDSETGYHYFGARYYIRIWVYGKCGPYVFATELTSKKKWIYSIYYLFQLPS